MNDTNSNLEIIEDPSTGLYIELDRAGSQKYVPEDDDADDATMTADASQDLGGNDAAKKAAESLDAGAASRPDAGKPKGASNALLFHQWDDKK